VGATPLSELGTGTYLRFQGGLYPGGSNAAPLAHHAEGVARAQAVAPLDANGTPSSAGAYALLSIGMSNTTQEFCSQGGGAPCTPWSFMGQAAADPAVEPARLRIVNGARGGQPAQSWDDPLDANYDRVRDTVLAPAGLTEAQVAVVWVKQANPQPQASLPEPQADALALEAALGRIARAVRTRYPNAMLVLLSNRIYAGYADTTLNPEPYAYESAFAVKWLIQAQIAQMQGGGVDPVAGDLALGGAAPWLGWGPDLWADGLTARADGLFYTCDDLEADGTHPAQGAEQKVGAMLLGFMKSSPYAAPWFLAQSAAVPLLRDRAWTAGAAGALIVTLLSLLALRGRRA
jgi:hypothetical protein